MIDITDCDIVKQGKALALGVGWSIGLGGSANHLAYLTISWSSQMADSTLGHS